MCHDSLQAHRHSLHAVAILDRKNDLSPAGDPAVSRAGTDRWVPRDRKPHREWFVRRLTVPREKLFVGMSRSQALEVLQFAPPKSSALL